MEKLKQVKVFDGSQTKEFDAESTAIYSAPLPKNEDTVTDVEFAKIIEWASKKNEYLLIWNDAETNTLYLADNINAVGNSVSFVLRKDDGSLLIATITSTKIWIVSEFQPQEKLVSGRNIKTVNNVSLLGSGNINTSEVLWVFRNETPFSEIKEAYENGKILVGMGDDLDIQMDTYYNTYYEDNEYFDFTSVSGDVVKHYRVSNNNGSTVYSEIEAKSLTDVFVVEYNVTPLADINAAFNAGKLLVAVVDDRQYQLTEGNVDSYFFINLSDDLFVNVFCVDSNGYSEVFESQLQPNIQALIPNAASADNELADKAWVNNSLYLVGVYSELYSLNKSVSYANYPLVTVSKVATIVNNASNSTAITLNLHATVYAACQADTTQYTYNGQTYTGVIAFANAKNITIATD